MSEHRYEVQYMLVTGQSVIIFDQFTLRSINGISVIQDFFSDLKKLGFSCNGLAAVCCGKIITLNIEDVKFMLDKYYKRGMSGKIIIGYNYKEIIGLYAGTLDILKCRYHYNITYIPIEYTHETVLFYVDYHDTLFERVLDRFDINGLGFENYRSDDKLRIAVRHETEFKKMQLIGLFDINRNYSTPGVILTNSWLDQVSWKL